MVIYVADAATYISVFIFTNTPRVNNLITRLSLKGAFDPMSQFFHDLIQGVDYAKFEDFGDLFKVTV